MPHTRNELLSWAKDAWEKITGKHREEEVTLKGWVVREQCGPLRFGAEKPVKGKDRWSFSIPCWILDLPYFQFKTHFSSVQWSDPEPTPCEITIKIKK